MKISFTPHSRQQSAMRDIRLHDVCETIKRVGYATPAPQGRTLYEVRAEDILRFKLDPVRFNGLRVVTAPQRFAEDGVLVVTIMREYCAY